MNQPVRTAPGQTYGAATAQANAQKVVPLPGASPTPVAQPQPQQPLPAPGSLGGITDPTARPGEPVTHGLPIGPGGGPSALGFVPSDDMRVLAIMRRSYMRYPTQGLLDMIGRLEAQVGVPR